MGPVLFAERLVGYQCPGFVFGGVRGLTVVVCFKSCIEIFSKSNVCLIGIRYAAKKVNVKHIAASS